jgi:hypothetical protein
MDQDPCIEFPPDHSSASRGSVDDRDCHPGGSMQAFGISIEYQMIRSRYADQYRSGGENSRDAGSADAVRRA